MVDFVKMSPGATVFRLGSSGPAVKAMQLGLRELGYPLSGTGYFGNATDVAVDNFRKLHGMPDGDMDNAFAAMLDAAIADKQKSGISKPVEKVIERPLWVQAGMKLLGTKEDTTTGDNQAILYWAREEGGNIAKEYTHDVIPWCALFANHCLTKASLKGTETLWALDFAGNWPSVKLPGPVVGAFAPMVRNGGGHIIIVVGRDQHGNIMGLGGNQSDKVSIIPFPMSRLNKGFWWPKSVPLPPNGGISSLPVVLSDGRVSSKEA